MVVASVGCESISLFTNVIHAPSISYCSQKQMAEISKELKNEQDRVRGFQASGGGLIMTDKLAEAEMMLEQKTREIEVLEVIT